MEDDTTITPLHQPGSVEDPLTEIVRDGARRMLAAALRAEADAFVAQHAEEILPDGRQRVVRHGYGPERSIQTGIGALDVQRPKVRDRATDVARIVWALMARGGVYKAPAMAVQAVRVARTSERKRARSSLAQSS